MSKLTQPYTKERLKLVLDSTRLGMWDWNPQTNDVVFDKNWAAMLGLTLDDLTMTLEDWSSRVHPEDIDSCFEDIQKHMQGDLDFYENLHRMRHADGHWVYILDRGRVVEWDEEGKPTRFTGTHSDLTPLKRAEFKASAALKERERFFSSMSHELRAPIHAMLGIVDLVAHELTDTELKDQLKTVQDSGQHLLLIIKDILDAAKIQESDLELSDSDFDLTELLQYVLELHQVRATQKGLKLELKVADDCGDVWLNLDRSRLVQVLINLLSNAIKYTDHGTVTLALSKDKAGFTISVKDTGRGINDIDKIFEPYSQENSHRFDDENSTGLGLYICRKLTGLLGLSMQVDSEIGKGSDFQLLIPGERVVPAKASGYAPKDHREIEPEEIPGASILIVDDTPVNLLLASSMLKKTPMQIYIAKEGFSALKILESHAIDIVFTDLHMPQLGGLRLSHEIRNNSALHQPKIIAQSADAQSEVLQRCLDAGMDAYLPKPFNQQDLFRTLLEVLK